MCKMRQKNTLDNLLRLNLLDDFVVLKLLDSLLE